MCDDWLQELVDLRMEIELQRTPFDNPLNKRAQFLVGEHIDDLIDAALYKRERTRESGMMAPWQRLESENKKLRNCLIYLQDHMGQISEHTSWVIGKAEHEIKKATGS